MVWLTRPFVLPAVIGAVLGVGVAISNYLMFQGSPLDAQSIAPPPVSEITARTLPDVFWLSLAPIIASVGGLIVAIGTLVVSLRVSHKADEIHVSTNGNLTALKDELREAKKKIEDMHVEFVTVMTNSASAARVATTEALGAALTSPSPKETP